MSGRQSGKCGVMSQSLATEDPVRRCMVDAHCEHRLPWLAAMRSEVTARESNHLWRRTDDEHPTCVLRPRGCSAEVLFCRHYGLWQCTDETSADITHKTSACRTSCGECWAVVATFVPSRLTAPVPQHDRSRQGFIARKHRLGVGRYQPLLFLSCAGVFRKP